MWAGSPPTLTADESAKACARGIGNANLRQRVEDACPEFLANSSKLQTAAAGDRLHEARTGDYSVSDLSPAELLWLYTGQLSRIRKPGREVYDKIMGAAPFDRCLYCVQSAATTLDHFVPKSRIPGLSIDPWNLVPACFECNHHLLQDFSGHPTEQLLHPYFIPVIGRWLTASIDHIHPLVVRFAAAPNASLAPELRARIQNQFARLKLGQRYSVLCGRDITGLSRRLPQRFDAAKPGELSAHLSESAQLAFATDPNDRLGVMYEALSADEWYCAGGYVPPPAVTV